MASCSTAPRVAALDFRERAPQRYTFTSGLTVPGATPLGDPFFGTGHNVVGVPGTVAGLAAGMRRFGRLELADVIAPAIRLARDGFPVTATTAAATATHLHRLRLYDAAARIYLKDGLAPYRPGDRLVQADYAASLAAIAQAGPDAFYRGPIAAAIVAAMETSGAYPGDRGTLSRADLADYRPIWRRAIRAHYRDAFAYGMPAPSSGGTAMAQILNILEGFDLGRLGASSDDALHLVAEAQKLAWADRNAYLGDPAYTTIPAELTSEAYAARRRAEIDLRVAKTYQPGAAPAAAQLRAAGDRGGHTTHVSVIDRHGSAASITCTIEQLLGSAVVAPGTGFLLNNQLTDFDAPGTANAPAPGKRPRSSTSPTIVVRDRKPVLVSGGADGPSIIMGVVHTVLNTLDFGMDPAHAVDAQRSDARGLCAGAGLQLCLEDARIPGDVVDDLRARGHQITTQGEYAPLPLVQVAGVDPRTGIRRAASDPRNGPREETDTDGAVAEPGGLARRRRG